MERYIPYVRRIINNCEDTFFEVGNPAGQVIIYIIMALLLFGFLKVVYNFVRIFYQKSFLKTAMKRFTDLPSLSAETEVEAGKKKKKRKEKSEAEVFEALGEARDKILENIPLHSVIGRRIQNLFKIRYVGDLTFESLREQLFSEESEKTAFCRYLASIFILLGLIGTVLGLSQSVIALQPLLSELSDIADLSNISRAISTTLSGMRTAFSATIAGIGATVILTFINFLYGKYSTSFLIKMESFTTLSLAPYFLVPTREEAAIRFADSLTKGAEMLDGSTKPLLEVSEHLKESVTKIDSFTTNFTNTAENFDKAVNKLSEAQDGLIKSQQQTESRFKEVIQKSDDILQKFHQDTQSLTSGSNKAIQEAAKAIIGDTKEAVTKFVNEYLGVMRSLSTDANEAMKISEENYQQKVADLAETFLNNIKNALTSNREEVQKIIKTQSDSHSEITGKHEEILKEYSSRVYDLISMGSSTNHYKEMENREKRLIELIESLVNNIKEVSGDLWSQGGPGSGQYR